MENEKVEGKQIVHGLHIGDRDAEGSRTLPSFQRRELISRSNSVHFFPQTSTSCSNIAGVKRKVLPIYPFMNERSHSSHGPGGVSRPSNYRKPDSSSSSMMHNKCTSFQLPYSRISYSNGCTDLAVSSCLRTGKIFNRGNPQPLLKKERGDAGKLHGASSNETKCGDQATGLLVEESSKVSQNDCIYSYPGGNRISDPSITCNQLKQNSSENGTITLNLPQSCLEFKSKSVADGISEPDTVEDSDCNQWTKIDPIKDDSLMLKIGQGVETRDEDSTLSPDEVERVFGPKLFLEARKRMVHQQKMFSLQIFELHRLITVQKYITRSPQILHENSFDPTKPSIKFPPINNLLYVASLDTSPKAKIETLKSNHGAEYEAEAQALSGLLPLPTTDVDKGHFAHLLNPKSLQIAPPYNPKLPPWCFPGNQWLVPVRSPSEGLIYKPYPGPCFPNIAGFMPPVYGNCTPIGLSLLGGATNNDHESGGLCSTELGHTYLQPYSINPNPELKQVISSADLDKTLSTGNSNFFVPHQIPSQQSAVVSDHGRNILGSDASETSTGERLEGEALSLFPTTPSPQAVKNEQRVHAIKVVPHNRMSASASAARIFQSIQEERRKHEILLEPEVRAVGEKSNGIYCGTLSNVFYVICSWTIVGL